MRIGIPREIQDHEDRVALTPAAVKVLVEEGHEVLVESGAGVGSSFTDDDYVGAGAKLHGDSDAIHDAAEMIVKVKAPVPEEFDRLREGRILFTFLHLAANADLTRVLLEKKITAVAFETVQEGVRLPILEPMSEVAGRLAPQVGASSLERIHGGRGVLLGGVPGVRPAQVVILGGGNVGFNAARIASAMGAITTVLDRNLDRLKYVDEVGQGHIHTLASNRPNLMEILPEADLVIGAVLIAGAKTPYLLREADLASMRSGAVLVDVAVDQGGCCETTRPTTHSDPTYVVDRVVHYAVSNMPGMVPLTSTLALVNAALPYITRLAKNPKKALAKYKSLRKGLNVYRGHVTNQGVAHAHSLPLVDSRDLLGMEPEEERTRRPLRDAFL